MELTISKAQKEVWKFVKNKNWKTESLEIFNHLVEEIGEIARALRKEDKENLKEELIDRFGQYPPEVELFLMAIELKILAGKLFAERIIVNERKIKLIFDQAVEKVIAPLDHRHLDHEIDYFKNHRSTGEEIVKYLWQELEKYLGKKLFRLKLWETNNNYFELERID